MLQPPPLDRARPRRRAKRWGLALAGPLGLLAAHCTFPEYDTAPALAPGGAGGASTAGASGATVTGATGGGSTAGDGSGLTAGDRADAGAGGAPECAAEQWPVEHCAPGCLQRLPDHCYDGSQSGDEIAVDCGGSCQACTNEACSVGADCLSGSCAPDQNGMLTCEAPLTILYTPQERNTLVGTAAWSIKLTNSLPNGGKAFKLADVKVRYYFDRSDVVEPVFVRGSQASLTYDGGKSQSLGQTTWTVVRTENTADTAYNAYVEVGFVDPMQLFPGDHVDLYQQMLTGDPATSQFNQSLAYSFSEMTELASLHITVFYQGALVWGLEPRPANPRSCFARGVNLNGPALLVSGQQFDSAAQAGVVVSGGSGVSQGTATFPATTGSLASLLQTGTRLQQNDSLTLPVDNGTYLTYLYLTSPQVDSMPSGFTLQPSVPAIGGEFRAQSVDGGQAWARVGPFRVDVSDGKLVVAVMSGVINFNALELWYPD